MEMCKLLIIFMIGFAKSLDLNLTTVDEDMVNYVNDIVIRNANNDCICMVMRPKDSTPTIERIMNSLSSKHLLYTLSTNDAGYFLFQTASTTPRKPRSCFYILHYPTVKDNGLILDHGTYFRNHHFKNDSRYLLIGENHNELRDLLIYAVFMFRCAYLEVNFLLREGSALTMYTTYPFGEDLDSCPGLRIPYKMVAQRDPGQYDIFETDHFPNRLPKRFNRCHFNISGAEMGPFTLALTKDLVLIGFEANILFMVEDYLNISTHRKIYWRFNLDHNAVKTELESSLIDMALYRSELAIGGYLFAPFPFLEKTTSFASTEYRWYLPEPDAVPKWKLMYYALPMELWLGVFSACLILPLIYRWVVVKSGGYVQLSDATISFIALVFSNTNGSAPEKLAPRSVFLGWVLFTWLIDQVYLGELIGLITTSAYEPMIRTWEEHIASGLPTLMPGVLLYQLRRTDMTDFADVLDNSELLSFEDFEDAVAAISLYKNYTLFAQDLEMRYLTGLANSNISIYEGTLAVQGHMGFLMHPHHYLLKLVNECIRKLSETGHTNLALRHVGPGRFWSRSNIQTSSHPFKITDLSGPFIVLIVGLTLSTLVFIGEMTFFRLKNRQIAV